jgi:CheY-like chemotaxis protein
MAHRILLADDSLTIQKVIELTFSGAEWELRAVGTGDRAIQALEDFKPEVVLADVVMPGLTGYEVCEAVKRLPDGAFIPVVLLSGTFEPFDRSRADRAGCDLVVTKPFDAQGLAAQVRQLVENAKLARAAAPPPPPPAPPKPEPEPEMDTADLTIPLFGMTRVAAVKPPAPRPPEELTAPVRSFEMDLVGLDEDVPRRDLDEDIAAFERSGKAQSPPTFWDRPAPLADEDERTGPLVTHAPPASPEGGDLETLAAGASLSELTRMIPEQPPQPPPPPPPAPERVLSEDEVDRIARRLVEVIGERIIRKVAWDVVPEMAERLVKERLREIEKG